jgi:hypothetical protein
MDSIHGNLCSNVSEHYLFLLAAAALLHRQPREEATLASWPLILPFIVIMHLDLNNFWMLEDNTH